MWFGKNLTVLNNRKRYIELLMSSYGCKKTSQKVRNKLGRKYKEQIA